MRGPAEYRNLMFGFRRRTFLIRKGNSEGGPRLCNNSYFAEGVFTNCSLKVAYSKPVIIIINIAIIIIIIIIIIITTFFLVLWFSRPFFLLCELGC